MFKIWFLMIFKGILIFIRLCLMTIMLFLTLPFHDIVHTLFYDKKGDLRL